MFSEILTGERISVAAPFFNKVNGPLFLMLLLLMGVAPLLGWRHTSLAAFRKQFTIPILTAIAVGALVFVVARSLYPVIGLAICGFVAATILQEYVRGVMARRTTNNENALVAIANLWSRNGRRYGGYIVHLGIVMIGVAVIGNEFYQQSLSVTLASGESATIGRYELRFNGMATERQSNRIEFNALIDAYNIDSGRQVGVISPQRNIYDKAPDMPTSEVGLHMTPFEDVYVVLNGWEGGGASATFTIYINPLTMWMWLGGIVLVLGTLIATWPHPTRRRTETVSSLAYAAGDD
jgi:cytochrome c-type biogenesis protein CcmF